MTIYLYKKTHNKTGMQYLGKTSSPDPHKYRGSGDMWKLHIKEHGYDVTTEILRECKTNGELTYWGRYYSEIWNVSHSPDWANKIPETGGGCGKGIDSKTATLLNLKRVTEGTHPFMRREDGTSFAMDRVKNGTNNLLGPDMNKKRVENGTHPFMKRPDGTSHASDMVLNGTNPFLGPSGNLKMLAEGKHPSQQKKTCEHCGKTVSVGMYKRWHSNNCRTIR